MLQRIRLQILFGRFPEGDALPSAFSKLGPLTKLVPQAYEKRTPAVVRLTTRAVGELKYRTAFDISQIIISLLLSVDLRSAVIFDRLHGGKSDLSL